MKSTRHYHWQRQGHQIFLNIYKAFEMSNGSCSAYNGTGGTFLARAKCQIILLFELASLFERVVAFVTAITLQNLTILM